MAYEFTKLSEVLDTETVSDECNVIIEDGGEIKKTAKSNIGKAQVQADWNQTDPTQPDYIKNKLSCNEPYKQLVTDGDGSPKWEDRLAYDDSRVVIDASHGVYFVHVSSNIPEGLTEGGTITVWDNTGNISTGTPTAVTESLFYGEFGVVALVDGVENSGITIPKRGIYFTYMPSANSWVSGVAFGEATEPEITWDGNIGSVKKIDEKFLPEPLILYVHESESGV